ncbi:phosphatase PAP2 family protein [Cryptosporangium sp. NPDC051539]|uniref:phosphatase PAP2 family protein n=1 Tax=Cryptosporangium sp. NPDC051539 TaxID=3363962 RepID=UPI00379FACE5
MKSGVVQRALREVPLIAVLYLAYLGGRLLASQHTGAAFQHAESLWSFERWLGLPSEHSIQHAALGQSWLIELMNTYYARVHFPATLAVLVWLFLRRPATYPWFRWTLVLLTGFALAGHILYPLAPPRMLTDHGMVDTAHVYGQSVYGPVGTGLANQFAAMPSMHVAWAVLVAVAVIRTVRSRWRLLAVLHPLATVAVVIVTGNHYWLDGIVGCALLLVALAIVHPGSAHLRAAAGRARPRVTAATARLRAAALSTGTVARRHVWPFVRFVVVGSASTLLSAVIFVPLLLLMPSAAANTVASIVSTLLSNEAHRSWTFRSDRSGFLARLAAAGTVLLSYVVTTGALLVLDAADPHASNALELTVMLAASAVGGLARYLLLSLHVFPAAESAEAAAPLEAAGPVETADAAARQAQGVGSPASTHASALSMASSHAA